jgi:hypothetical protein
MSRADSQPAACIRAFAVHKGCAERTARWHRKTQSAEWMAWIVQAQGNVQVIETPTPPANGHTAPAKPLAESLPDALSRALTVEAECWRAVEACTEQKRLALAGRKSDMALGWIKAEAEAIKSHREARRDRVQLSQSVGHLIPSSQIDDIRTNFLQPINDLFRTAASEIAAEANPLAPPIAQAAVTAWIRRRLQPQLLRLSKALPDPIGSMPADESKTGTGEPVAAQGEPSAQLEPSSA